MPEVKYGIPINMLEQWAKDTQGMNAVLKRGSKMRHETIDSQRQHILYLERQIWHLRKEVENENWEAARLKQENHDLRDRIDQLEGQLDA